MNFNLLPAKVFRFFKSLGPGLITGSSDDDPSGIATYSQAGAGFGLTTLWTSIVTLPLMTSIQEMCARIGIITGNGLAGTLKKHYPKSVLYSMIAFSFPAITLNIGADIAAMGAVSNLLIPRVPANFFSIGFTIFLIFVIIKYPYQKLASVLKWLCLTLLLYLIVPFSVKQDWGNVLKNAVVPSFRFDKQFVGIMVAILGTTISPYLFFWQATMEAEDIAHNKKKVIVDKKLLQTMQMDVGFGMFFSCLIMFFITLTAGSVLFPAGVTQIDTVEQAAKALEPLTGEWAYLLFAIGIIGTGLIAIPVLSGSLSYILAESFGWEQGLDKKFNEAKGFYITLIVSLVVGLLLDFVGITPIQALIYSAILYGVTSPIMIAVILHIGNNKKVMGEFTNSRASNVVGFFTFLLMTVAAIALLYLQIAT
jgi:NRAMP (natural resistance-associated macrophage protein)-like metal ion transporter